MDTVVTLSQILELYNRDRLPRPATSKTLKNIISVFHKNTGLHDIHAVTKDHLLKWRNDILIRASAETWNNYHRHLRLLGNFAVKEGLLQENPFTQVSAIRSGRKKKKTIDGLLLSTALKQLRKKNNGLDPGWFWATVIRTFFFTGMRRSQLIGLTWKDISLPDRNIHLAASYNKTHCDHDIPLPGQIEQDLIDLYKRTLKANPKTRPTDQVFNITLFNKRYSGNRLGQEQVSGFFKRLSKHLGEPISSHRLRHTMATELIKVTDAATVQQQLGHRDVTTTLSFYVHPNMDRMRNAVKTLNI